MNSRGDAMSRTSHLPVLPMACEQKRLHAQQFGTLLKSKFILTRRSAAVSEYSNKVFDDCLFLQRFERPRSTKCRQRRGPPLYKPCLWMPRLQRPMRPLRPHHPQDHRRNAARRQGRVPSGLCLRATRRRHAVANLDKAVVDMGSPPGSLDCNILLGFGREGLCAAVTGAGYEG